jgi:transcriptional regulator with XRE-family HTH domain
MEKLARLLQERMDQEKLSVRKAAKLIGGVSHSTVARVLNGETVEVDTLIRISDFLKVPVAELLDVEEGPRELIGKLRKLVSFEPELGEVLSKIEDGIINGEIDMKILSEISAFAAFRLDHYKKKGSN